MNNNMKRILCYGDSLTWGKKPATNNERFDFEKRWTGVLQNLLGKNFIILEEGLNGRTLDSDDERPGKEGRNGSKSLEKILDKHNPIDILILMLGTNELKDIFKRDIEDIPKIIEEKYLKIIESIKYKREGISPSILIISPPPIDITNRYASAKYSLLGNKMQRISQMYKEIAKKHNCSFLDASLIVFPGEDGIHLDEDNHRALGEAIYKKLQGYCFLRNGGDGGI